MTISGFTFSRNAQKYYFPIRESIESVLPLVDEFVVVLGDSDADDKTRAEIDAIGSDKIKIFPSTWDETAFPDNSVYAQQTDLAKSHCKGDWLFYVQNDEVIHEADHPRIVQACEQYYEDPSIDGLLFEYLHFWGDYDHYHRAHNWYPREIRIIRNNEAIHSYKDAQSFRIRSNFGGTAAEYLGKDNSSKLSVARIGARVFHYGWVRPPEVMTKKARLGNPYLAQKEWNGKRAELPDVFDFGPLDRLAEYQGTHPRVMHDRIASMHWKDRLQISGAPNRRRPRYKHERLKYRFLSWFEYSFLQGRQIGGFRNYKIKQVMNG